MMMTSCTIVIVTSFKYLLLYIALFQEQLCKKKKLAFLYHNETKLDEKKYIYFSQSFYLLIIVRFSCFILWKKVKKKKKVTMTMTRPPYFKLNMWHKNQTRQLENYTFGLLWFHFSILGLHGLHTDSSIPYRGYLWIQKNDWPIAFRCLCYVKSLNRH